MEEWGETVIPPNILYGDNMSSKVLNFVNNLLHHWLNAKDYIPSNSMLADCLTEPSSKAKHRLH